MTLRQTDRHGKPLWAPVPHALLSPEALKEIGPALPLLLAILARRPARAVAADELGAWTAAAPRSARRHLAALGRLGLVHISPRAGGAAVLTLPPFVLDAMPARPDLAGGSGQNWPGSALQPRAESEVAQRLRRKERRKSEARPRPDSSRTREALVAAAEALAGRGLGPSVERAVILAVRQALRAQAAPPDVVRACVEHYLERAGGDSHGRPALSPYAYLVAAIPREARERLDRALDDERAARIAPSRPR